MISSNIAIVLLSSVDEGLEILDFTIFNETLFLISALLYTGDVLCPEHMMYQS